MTKANDLAALPNSPLSFRNKIINGAMEIDQRRGGALVNPAVAGNYYLDRWYYNASQASKFSVGLNAGSVTPPPGFVSYLGYTSLSAYAVTATDTFYFSQRIEGINTIDLAFGSASAKTITISFWVRSSLTGTFGGNIGNSAGNRTYVFSFAINAANTWEYKTVTIPGDTTGTWLKDTGIGLELRINLGSGANYSGASGSWGTSNLVAPTGAVSVVGTNGATFYITGVQLEVGPGATSFERRPYGAELALCQRYFAASVYTEYHFCAAPGATYLSTYRVDMPVQMRANPSISVNYSASNAIGTYGWYTNNQNFSVHYITASVATNAYMYFSWTTSAEL